MWPFLRIVHLCEPLCGGGEGAPVIDQCNSHMSIIQVEVKRDTPHHNQSHGQLSNLENESKCEEFESGCIFTCHETVPHVPEKTSVSTPSIISLYPGYTFGAGYFARMSPQWMSTFESRRVNLLQFSTFRMTRTLWSVCRSKRRSCRDVLFKESPSVKAGRWDILN